MAGWRMSIVENPCGRGVNYPVFCWEFTPAEQPRKAVLLHAWVTSVGGFTHKGFPVYSRDTFLSDLTSVQDWLRSSNLPEPPLLEEVAESVSRFRSVLPFKSKEDAAQAAKGLRAEWKQLITSHRSPAPVVC